jgi:hypothetical protein
MANFDFFNPFLSPMIMLEYSLVDDCYYLFVTLEILGIIIVNSFRLLNYIFNIFFHNLTEPQSLHVFIF